MKKESKSTSKKPPKKNETAGITFSGLLHSNSERREKERKKKKNRKIAKEIINVLITSFVSVLLIASLAWMLTDFRKLGSITIPFEAGWTLPLSAAMLLSLANGKLIPFKAFVLLMGLYVFIRENHLLGGALTFVSPQLVTVVLAAVVLLATLIIIGIRKKLRAKRRWAKVKTTVTSGVEKIRSSVDSAKEKITGGKEK